MDAVLQTSLQMVLFSFMLQSSLAQQQPNSNFTLTPISCYVCNSGEGFDGAACNPAVIDDKFKLSFTRQCPSQDSHGSPYTHCRRIVQSAETDSRVIRSCATAGTSGRKGSGCSAKVGTARITMKYCDCYNTSPSAPCNSGQKHNVVMTSLFTSALFSLLVILTKTI